MLKQALSLCMCAPLFFGIAQAQEEPTPTIQDLHRLIGTWKFEDSATENAGYEYSETGTRVCEYAIDDQYIRCESHGKTDTKERTYVFYWNYNKEDERFEMISLFGNYSRKIQYHVAVSDDGKRIDMTSGPNPEEEEREQSWATVIFHDDGTAIWESRSNSGDDLPNHWPVTFLDVATKVQ